MPKVQYRTYLEGLQNLINSKPSHVEIAEILIKSGITKQKNVKKLANNLSNRLFNNGFLSSSEVQILDRHYKSSQVVKDYDYNEIISLDYYPEIFGSCGNGVFALSPIKEKLNVPHQAFFAKFIKNKQYSVINAMGNSMEPLIYDKDKVIVEHWNGEQIIDNRPYIFCYKDEIFIKRLAKNINQLMIIPENKDYDVIKLNYDQLNDFHIIGQIVGLMRDLK